MSLHRRARHIATLAPLLIIGCAFSPLSNRIEVGEEAFVVFVATGPDGNTDLYATPAGGGTTARITFTPLTESRPALSGRGDMLIFMRSASGDSATTGDLVVMNLLNGAERTLPLPAEIGSVERLAWGSGDTMIIVGTAAGIWEITPPPAEPTARRLTGPALTEADSLLGTWLGEPRFARAFNCPAAGGVCLIGPSGDTTSLTSRGRDPFRWGSDSVAWFEGEEMMVRGLGPGIARTVRLGPGAPSGIREGSYTSP
ncbi:MAG: hypothetical protein U0974_15605 [Gemmatimonadales bacterium]|nr:hypothetical protein [Gemmatimonadales bacterium]MDZ4391148.1 hypothetical protein [Gemmatimonadales bacterium]